MRKKRKKDYHTKDFKNPHFKNSKKSKSKIRFRFLVIFLIIIIFTAIIYIAKNPDFIISKIDIKGVEQIDESDISLIIQGQLDKRRFLFFRQNNILFFKKSKLEKTLNQNYELDKVKINKNWPDELIVTVVEKPISLVLISDNKQYYIDEHGVATSVVGENSSINIQQGLGGTEVIRLDSKTLNYPTLTDQSNREVVLGKEVLPLKTVEFLEQLHDGLSSNIDFEISHYTILSPTSDEINLVTKDGWFIYFSADKLVAEQLSRLSLILRQRVENIKNLEYIDLRFGEKVFYK